MTALHRTTASGLWCKYCQTVQPEEAFEVCRVVGAKFYRRLKCKQCKQARATERRRELRLWFDRYKSCLHCERCGFSDYRALVFHHRDDQEKVWNIGDMIKNGVSRQSIERELTKCSVLCANCHQILHYEDRA
jgi:hypothetical protein